MSDKLLLILERSEGNLVASKDGDKYVMEGIFTEIGVKNKNQRIYDEKEIIPHINEMKEKLKGNKLLGELDHPKTFDISLKNASHVIESLSYDPATKKVMGRIKLLNTTAGKEAMALVDAGVPLHISSRAAGVVESNGHVKIKKMFTYDLVADPGFENAELKRVNESFGIDSEYVQIYETNATLADFNLSNQNIETEPEKTSEIKVNEMNNEQQFVSVEDFNNYSKILKNEIEHLKEKLAESNNATPVQTTADVNESLIEYVETIANRVNKMHEFVNKLTENVDNIISHNDYIIEGLENVKNYSEMVAEKTAQGINYTESIVEKTDKAISYMEMIAEKTAQGINYTEKLSESLNGRFKYQDYINENVDNLISHNDYIIESSSSLIKYANYLNKNTENLTNYMERVVEGINEGLVVGTPEATPAITVNESKNEDFKSALDNKLNAILESAKAQKEPAKDNLHFKNFLSESKKNQFEALTPEMKDKVIGIFENSKYYGSVDVENIYDKIFETAKAPLNWLTNIPAKYITSWNSLNESQKNSIKAQASVKVLETSYQIENFWETRELRSNVIAVNESQSVIAINESSEYVTDNSYMEAVQAGFKKRFNR